MSYSFSVGYDPTSRNPNAPADRGGRRAVDLRVHAEGASRVELLGEMADWLTPKPLARDASGAFVAALELPPGVYAYKLKIDGRWALDRGNPRTRQVAGAANNVLSIGGAPEPLLFAPGAPFVHEEASGGVAVTAALRHGAGDELAVLWTEDAGAPTRRTPMARIADEDEHAFFYALLPISAASASLLFELADGTRIGEEETAAPFRYVRTSAAAEAPAWWRDAVVYTVFVDRFRAAEDDAAWGADPGANVAAGGHLDGVRRALGELADLGVDTLYLTPVQPAASCHRYDLVDPMRVDPALGGEEAFARLVADAHGRGMRVLLDFSFAHVGRGFPPYEDVLAHGAASPYAAWFVWRDGALVHYGKRSDAPLLDLEHPNVRALVVATAVAWASRGVDGFRLDAAAEFPIDLAATVRKRLRAIRPEAVMIGEVVPAHAWRWRAAGALDAATDFGFFETLTAFVARRSIDGATALERLAAIERGRGAPASYAMRFLSTHDHPRFATWTKVDGAPERALLGLFVLFTSPGVPALLYGEELGLTADVPALEPEAVWPDRMPMAWRAGGRSEATRARLRELIAARRASPALSGGSLELLHGEGAVLVFRRRGGGEVVDVAINVGDEPLEIDLDDDALPAATPIAHVGTFTMSMSGATVALGRASGVALRRGEGAGRRGARRLLAISNERARDEGFAASRIEIASRPTRIDFALTETCNLRCRHCITSAPERTQNGTARTLSPFLLERIRPHLALASYFGFVHGGESLTTPMLFDMLEAIRDARASAPYVAHLLTNGLMLSERTTRALIERGVSSLFVSLDGATAATNDAVRVGGRFERIVANLRSAVDVRRTLGADLRLGISYVMMRENLAQTTAIVELAAQLGVDWVKLEEMVPVTPFAQRSLVDPGALELRARVFEATARASELGIVLVDHTAPPPIVRCQLAGDARATEFLAADEFANRATLHPCRVPWEHACIEPNGDVKLGDFFGQTLGNLAFEPLEVIWNGAVARSERQRAIAARPCGHGPVTCVPSASPTAS